MACDEQLDLAGMRADAEAFVRSWAHLPGAAQARDVVRLVAEVERLKAEVERLEGENDGRSAIVAAATDPAFLNYLRNLADHQTRIRGRIRDAVKAGERAEDGELDGFLTGEIEILKGFLSSVDATTEKGSGSPS